MAGKKASSGGKKGKASKPAVKRTAKRSKPVVKNVAPAEADAPAAAGEAQGVAPQSGAQPADQQQTTISTSRGFVDFLATNRLSIALTSYQTGQLMLIGPLLDGRLSVFQRNFVRAMGLWASPQRLYLSTIAQIWRLENVLGPGQLANQQTLHYERLYVPRISYTTGDIDAHELGIDANDRLIFVNTKYSCLATPDAVHSFKPLWKPSFISKIAPEDRCHLNGLAMQNGAPKYVTAVSRCDVVDGWRERRHEGGILIDVETDRVLTEDLSMPHSPRLNAGTLVGARFGPRLSLPRRCQERQARARGVLPGLCARAFLLARLRAGRHLAAARRRLQGARARGQHQGARRRAALRRLYRRHRAPATSCIGFASRAPCASCSTRPSFPACSAPMCVGLGNPEMRTLITFDGESAIGGSSRGVSARLAKDLARGRGLRRSLAVALLDSGSARARARLRRLLSR